MGRISISPRYVIEIIRLDTLYFGGVGGGVNSEKLRYF